MSELELNRNSHLVNPDESLSSLDDQELLILKVISEFDGIQAKELGKKINLSRYAALIRAKHLIHGGFLDFELLHSSKTGIKPTYLFHLSPKLTPHIIDTEILHREVNSGKQKAQLPNQHFKTNQSCNHQDNPMSPINSSPDESLSKVSEHNSKIQAQAHENNMKQDSIQTSSSDNPAFLEASQPVATNIIKLIKEFLVLKRQTAVIEEKLQALGGKEAEELIAELRQTF